MLNHLANSQRIHHGSSTRGSEHHYSWGLWGTAALKASSNGLPFETNLHCAASIYSQIDLSPFEGSFHIYHLSSLKSLWLYVGDLLTSINACHLQTANYSDISAKWDCVLRLVRFCCWFQYAFWDDKESWCIASMHVFVSASHSATLKCSGVSEKVPRACAFT